MARIRMIWFQLLDPNKQSFFLYWVNFCLTNVCFSASLIPGFEGVGNLGERQVHNFAQFLIIVQCTVCIHVCGSCWGKQVFYPCLEGVIPFNEAQTAIFIFLWPILASDSNPPVFFPQSPSQPYGPGWHLVLTKIRNIHRWDSSSQPSVSVAM